MRIVVISDVHGSLKALEAQGAVFAAADVVVVAGDITDFGHEGEARAVMELLGRFCDCVLAVSGNCDHPDVESYLVREELALQGVLYDLGGVVLTGLSGSLPCPHRTPNEFREADFGRRLQDVEADIRRHVVDPVVLISHHPPVDSSVDSTHAGSHVGSFAVRGFLQRVKPAVCVCGHIHEARGEAMVGETKVINPGPAAAGGYAVIELVDGRVEGYLEIPGQFRVARHLKRGATV